MGKKTGDQSQEHYTSQPPSAPPEFEEDGHQGTAASNPVAYPSLNSSTSDPSTPVNNPATPPPSYGTNDHVGQSSYAPQTNALGPQSGNDNNVPPPPSYNDAINCPAPPYLPNVTPKPPYMHGPQNGHPIYPPPISGTGYVLQAPVDVSHGTPQPHVIATTIITSGPNNCIHCYGGDVHNETDLCCLMCLILLAILTFPFGLILLCCIPCTIRKRCLRCRRLN